MKRVAVVLIMLSILALASGYAVAETTNIYTLKEGDTITLTFENPSSEPVTIEIQNINYPGQVVPLWISPGTVPANSTVTVVVHFYVTDDGVPAGRYAVSLYTPYQSYLLYLVKEGSSVTDDEVAKLYAEIQNLQVAVQSLYKMYEERFSELYNTVQDLKATQGADEKQIAELENELKLIRAELDGLNKQIETMNKLLLDMQKTVQTNDKKVSGFETKLQQYEKLLVEYDKKISVIDASLKQIDIEKYKQLDERLSAIEKKQAAMEQAIADAKSVAGSSSAQVVALQTSVNELENNYKLTLIGALAGVMALAMILAGYSGGNKKLSLPFGGNKSRGAAREVVVPVGTSGSKARKVAAEVKEGLSDEEAEMIARKVVLETLEALARMNEEVMKETEGGKGGEK